MTTNIYTSFCLVNSYNLPYKFVPCSNVLTFVGPEVHSPNLIGLEYFLKNCWSQLVYKIPSISLKVIGKWNPDTIKKISNTYPQVKFLGFVDNLYEALQGSIMVVPITIGSGIRTKILEAGFMGIPIVTTTIGVEGIPLVDYKDCIIEDNPSKMVEKIYDLINNIQQQQMLSWNAYNKIKTTYSDDALLKTREQALN